MVLLSWFNFIAQLYYSSLLVSTECICIWRKKKCYSHVKLALMILYCISSLYHIIRYRSFGKIFKRFSRNPKLCLDPSTDININAFFSCQQKTSCRSKFTLSEFYHRTIFNIQTTQVFYPPYQSSPIFLCTLNVLFVFYCSPHIFKAKSFHV